MDVRSRIRVTGTVQGVGFRPFVYRRAVVLGLDGFVRNDAAGVLIEVQGPADAVAALHRALRAEPPPLSRVTAVVASPIAPVQGQGFRIVATDDEGPATVAVSVDTATCAACLAEVDDPADRRFRYPFTNCTDCGPRYTIVTAVPYDRPATTMAGFVMCDLCRWEYDDPGDRRFHAQPNACGDCGPRLRFLTTASEPSASEPSASEPSGDEARGDDALEAAVTALRAGRILAVKGLGGYHLAVDATDEAAVAELRRRKARDDKPFAVLVSDLDQARELCDIPPAVEAELLSARRPIVLAERRPGAPLAAGVAPGLPEVGLLLAYTPLHHLLATGAGRPLVLTSGNVSDEPIAHQDDDARTRLAPLVDAILTHDRPIHIRCDDSVVRPVARADRRAGHRTQVLRRSRGYAPEPLALEVPARRPLLAVGAELKSTVAVAHGSTVVASHHLGDLEHLATYRAFLQAVDHLRHLVGVDPALVVHDLHPEYLSTKFALDLDLPSLGVQHHHAHVASCLVDHGHVAPVLGLAFDGLGYGPDATLWGGELLAADLVGFERLGHLRAITMPGGGAAIREPWRMAVAWVHEALGADEAARIGGQLDERAAALIDLVTHRQGPTTTSMGRLFDAAAAIVGLRSRVSYEGQAAIELEALARTVEDGAVPRWELELQQDEGGTLQLDPRPLIATLVHEQRRGTSPPLLAAGFHEAVGAGAAGAAVTLASRHGLDTVALTGGVFQNARLTGIVDRALHAAGLRVLVHERVPPNDGGISIGQAAVAAARSEADQA